MAPRPEKASLRTPSSGHCAVGADRQYSERLVIFPDVQLKNRTGDHRRFICASGSGSFLLGVPDIYPRRQPGAARSEMND